MTGIPLRCPYCGSSLVFYLEYGLYSDCLGVDEIDCDNYMCNAEWDKRGEVQRASDLARQLPL